MVGLRNSGAVSRMKSVQNWPASCSSFAGGARSTRSSSKPSARQPPLPARLRSEDHPVSTPAEHVAEPDAVVRRSVGALRHEQDGQLVHHALWLAKHGACRQGPATVAVTGCHVQPWQHDMEVPRSDGRRGCGGHAALVVSWSMELSPSHSKMTTRGGGGLLKWGAGGLAIRGAGRRLRFWRLDMELHRDESSAPSRKLREGEEPHAEVVGCHRRIVGRARCARVDDPRSGAQHVQPNTARRVEADGRRGAGCCPVVRGGLRRRRVHRHHRRHDHPCPPAPRRGHRSRRSTGCGLRRRHRRRGRRRGGGRQPAVPRGSFTTVNGSARKNLARVDLAIRGCRHVVLARRQQRRLRPVAPRHTAVRERRLHQPGRRPPVPGWPPSTPRRATLVGDFKPTVDRRVSSVASCRRARR